MGFMLGGPLGSGAAFGAAGEQISAFLARVKTKPLPIEFYQLAPTFPINFADATTPGGDQLYSRPDGRVWPVTLLDSECAAEARDAFLKAIAPAPFVGDPPSVFRPDCCIIYRETNGTTTLLWVDSNPAELQMQLWVTGDPGRRVDCYGIQVPAQLDGVRGALKQFLEIAESSPSKAFGAVSEMVVTIEGRNGGSKLQVELMSINPKQADNALGHKRWPILGKVTIPPGSDWWSDVVAAINLATDSHRRPEHTAHVFSPRLGISAQIPDDPSKPHGPKKGYLLLMSFECRLAQLYIDGQFSGCCAINDGWKFTKTGLPFDISSDQFLNNILAAAGKPLQAKSSASGN